MTANNKKWTDLKRNVYRMHIWEIFPSLCWIWKEVSIKNNSIIKYLKMSKMNIPSLDWIWKKKGKYAWKSYSVKYLKRPQCESYERFSLIQV